VNACMSNFYRDIRQDALGFVFLGTPHRGSGLSTVANWMSLLGHWMGSSTSLLDVLQINSKINEPLHASFMDFLNGEDGCGVGRTLCVYETVKEKFLGYPMSVVSGLA